MQLIKFANDGDGGLNPDHLHLEGPHTDHTLCGETLDGDTATAGSFDIVEASKVTCPTCIEIIRYCRWAKI